MSTGVANDDLAAATDCVVCREPIKHFLLGPCNHRHVCHMCGLRLRALYQTTSCPYCKVEAPNAVFTSNTSQPFNAFKLNTLHAHRKLHIYCDTEDLLKEVVRLLRFNCPACDATCSSRSELNNHIRKDHPKQTLWCASLAVRTRLFLLC